jgi:hypothetical protein
MVDVQIKAKEGCKERCPTSMELDPGWRGSRHGVHGPLRAPAAGLQKPPRETQGYAESKLTPKSTSTITCI